MEEYRRYLREYSREALGAYNNRHYAWYNLCCIASRLGDGKRALHFLRKAFDEN